MATNKVLRETGTQLLFADHATDFGAAPATAANSMIIGVPTDVQMNLSVIADAAGWESAKTLTLADTGTAWPDYWVLGAAMEGTATPTVGLTYDFYWNAATSGTAGTGNAGVASGADSAIVVTGSNLAQLTFIGSLVCLAQVINKVTVVGVLDMPYLYGSLIMVNNSGAAMVADADADECFAVLTPVYPDIQASA